MWAGARLPQGRGGVPVAPAAPQLDVYVDEDLEQQHAAADAPQVGPAHACCAAHLNCTGVAVQPNAR